MLRCEMCGGSFERPSNKGVAPRYCLDCRARREMASHLRSRRRGRGEDIAEVVAPAPADPDAPPGPVEAALLADLEVAPVGAAGLFEAARLLARRLDAGPPDRDAASITREFRQVVAALREAAPPGRSAVDEFLDSIRAEGF
jgi:hypothetical protein